MNIDKLTFNEIKNIIINISKEVQKDYEYRLNINNINYSFKIVSGYIRIREEKEEDGQKFFIFIDDIYPSTINEIGALKNFKKYQEYGFYIIKEVLKIYTKITFREELEKALTSKQAPAKKKLKI